MLLKYKPYPLSHNKTFYVQNYSCIFGHTVFGYATNDLNNNLINQNTQLGFI